ncbi:glycosyl transferase [Halovibrio salipaludis]|uniref:Glycosyl transferase n=1 Tax=Halovibrio salipaludis TaxID=2032626 RepID=A0A2A2F9D2_9GAMM|nr:glycosyltransferase [Halovibrio salipaludis]PAU81212.1 glycosyl transferase [Halovibrio salipaludis]
MSERPLVTIIIPAFNRAGFIRKSISSVLRQNYPNIELIVVDDGSTDGTYEILSDYSEKSQICLLIHESHNNLGQSASINLGITKASGRYIGILDSDDEFFEDKISKQVQYLEENPDFGMVYGRGLAVDSEGHSLFSTLPEEHQESGDPERLLQDCYIALPGGALIRKTLLDQAGFFEESFRAAQDHDMALRLFEIGRVAYVPDYVFRYTKHGDTISKNGLERRWRTGFEILERAKNRYPYSSKALRSRAAVLNFRLGQVYWRQGSRFSAFFHFLKASILDPRRALSVVVHAIR